ncbi:hypothetical protein GCM10008014_39530 [Paenibacillus silvae]|uniref:Uncharacterized protein n=1 Tax=Paenibacillus silvae TaxID=1325358 RepID=A0ABQ1ZIJ0_9BACL|nr:hypothetical protein GCM10008014_39530 [Paenibacillus silvae]
MRARKPPSIKGERSAPPAHHKASAPCHARRWQRAHLPAGLGQMGWNRALKHGITNAMWTYNLMKEYCKGNRKKLGITATLKVVPSWERIV